ncbi:unnamed protein product [Caenorhabditis angaria]|uniref:Fungal lipase-type domain-containing protein n=1 Tax=Caenorhabditis angaria TaxID=860376 RepID=A0A9P1IGW3_9PELO|nr:unnamed protein product [Caenorhabditis angaria]
MKIPFLFFAIFLSQVATKSQYSDAFARKFFPIVFAATEAKNATNCLNKVYDNFELKRHINVICDETEVLDTCSGLTFISHTDKSIVLAFRGTKGKLQLLVEGDETLFRNKTAWVGGGSVSFYFARAFNLVWNNGMKSDFAQLIHQYPDYDIWVGGHSLGGSMAALATNFIVANQLVTDASKIKLITFGEPRTGDQQFADAHDQMIKYSYRVIHKRDIVSHIPYKNEEGYRHHRNEIWYDNDMEDGAKYKECDSQESIFCSDGHLDYMISDHHRYFGMYMSFYGRRNCTGDPAN